MSEIEQRRAMLTEIETLKASIKTLTKLWTDAVVSMDSCACEWERHPEDPNEHTDKIVVLCKAHENCFDERAKAKP